MALGELLAVGIPAAILFFLYVRLIQKRNAALGALSSIDVQLKQRRDLIPNILAIAKETMTREIELIERVTELRASAAAGANVKDPEMLKRYLDTEAEISSLMQGILASFENYPETRFIEAMTQAQQSYEEVEAHISAARRFYNASAEDLKNAVEIFPSSLIASFLKIRAMPFFEISEADRKPVSAAEFFAA
ncbi:MAG: LemA family protein [Pseudomonadota bacterium]